MRANENNMSEDKSNPNDAIPVFRDYIELGEFWDTHSLADYWDETEPAEVELAPELQQRYLVPIEPDLLQRIHKLAQARGIGTESLVNLFLEQRIQQVTQQQ
jgi:hypothetical protein